MGSKYLKDVEERKSKIIHVYPNGDPYARATFIVLRQLEQKDLERIIKAVEEKVRLPRNRPIRKLFEMTGVLVKSCIQVEDGKYYVAASAENFFPLEYGKGVEWVMVGPVRTSKYANVRFVSKSEEEGPCKSLNSSSNMLSSTKDTKERPNQQKSPTKRTLASIKKGDKQKSVQKKNMAESEHIERPNICEDDREEHLEETSKEEHEPVVEHHPPTEVEAVKDLESKETEDVHTNKEDFSKVNGEGLSSLNEDEARIENTVDSENNSQKNKDNDHYEERRDHETEEDSLNIKECKDEFKHEDGSLNIGGQEDDSLNIGGQADDSLNIGGQAEHKEEYHNQTEETNDESKGLDQYQENQSHDGVDDRQLENGTDGDDGRLDEAATKIQATYRGHKVRADMGKTKADDAERDNLDDNTDVSEEINSQKENC